MFPAPSAPSSPRCPSRGFASQARLARSPGFWLEDKKLVLSSLKPSPNPQHGYKRLPRRSCIHESVGLYVARQHYLHGWHLLCPVRRMLNGKVRHL